MGCWANTELGWASQWGPACWPKTSSCFFSCGMTGFSFTCRGFWNTALPVNPATLNWMLHWIHYLTIFPAMSDSNMLFISHLSGLSASWIAEGTRGILGRLPRSAEHYKFQADPHSPRQLAHLLLASFLLCTRCYCNFFLLFGKGSKASSVMCWFKRGFFFFTFYPQEALVLSKSYANEMQKACYPFAYLLPP